MTRMAGRRFADRRRGLRALGWKRLNPAGAFALSLALGLVIIALAAVLFGTLAEDVTHGDGVAVLDHPVARFVTAHRSGALTSAMEAVSTAGGPATLAVIMLGAGLLLALTGRTWSPLLLLAVSVAGSSGLTAVFKAVLGRSRPPLAHAVAAADGYAFPSGHAATAVAALGVLAYLCTVRLASRAARIAVWAAAAMLAALVGISRVYLGVHWVTDVAGGWVFGILWMAVVLTGWTTFTRVRESGGAGQRADETGPGRWS